MKKKIYPTLRFLLSPVPEIAEEEREVAKNLARGAKTTLSSYLRRLLRAEYERKVEDFNPEIFKEFEVGGDYSTGNPKFIAGMKKRSQRPMRLKARKPERKDDAK